MASVNDKSKTSKMSAGEPAAEQVPSHNQQSVRSQPPPEEEEIQGEGEPEPEPELEEYKNKCVPKHKRQGSEYDAVAPILKYDPAYAVGPHDKKTNWSTKIHTAADMAPAISGNTKLLSAELSHGEVQDFLSVIFPPTEFEKHGQLYRQHVSSTQATDEDLKQLDKQIEARISRLHMHDNELCDAARQVYDECLDEIIRQVTIENPERGWVLRRIRDDIRANFHIYKTLYEASESYAARKSLLIETANTELKRIVAANEEALAELRKQVEHLEKQYDQLKKQEDELEQADQVRRQEELQFQRDINTQLRTKIDKFLASIKKASSGELAAMGLEYGGEGVEFPEYGDEEEGEE